MMISNHEKYSRVKHYCDLLIWAQEQALSAKKTDECVLSAVTKEDFESIKMRCEEYENSAEEKDISCCKMCLIDWLFQEVWDDS